MNWPPVILSIAGYDPSSGAGITADIKTAASQNCYAVTCITASTLQSIQGVFGTRPVESDWVARTLRVLTDDLEIAAVRLGMLGSGEVAATVADFLAAGTLAGAEPVATDSPWEEVLPRLRAMAWRLRELGSRAVVITGGHLPQANDYLLYGEAASVMEEVFHGVHLESRSTHGTGCAFATALACQLAHGATLPEAVRAAKDYVRKAIAAAYPLGRGSGPVNHAV